MMKSKKYTEIIDKISDVIREGKESSLLNRMQFDYNPNNKNEFVNYILIILVLLEKSNYEISNNIFLRKVILDQEKYSSYLQNKKDLFESIHRNAVFPYINLSTTIRNFIASIIYNKENEKTLRENIPDKEYLINLNIELLQTYLNEVNKYEKPDYRVYINLIYNCLDDIEEGSRKIYLSQKATEYFRKYITRNEKLFEDYLKHFLRPSGVRYNVELLDTEIVGPEPYYEQIFENKELFVKELEKLKTNISKEILVFFKEYGSDKRVKLNSLNLTNNLHKNLYPSS